MYPYWAGPLSDGVVVGLVAVNGAAELKVDFEDVPGLGEGMWGWKELYSSKTGTGTGVSVSLGSHDMVSRSCYSYCILLVLVGSGF